MSQRSIPQEFLDQLSTCRSIAILTGAGVSAESGVPTFRDAQTGLWAEFSATDLATPEAFQAHPSRVWDWYVWRRELIGRVQPNPGHLALPRLMDWFPQHQLVTQNVDGLHQQAGTESVLELHGNIHRTICSQERTVVASFDPKASPPLCPDCGAELRPDVIWFGEGLPTQVLTEAIAGAQSCDVYFSLGTSATVYPAAELPHTAKQHGAILVEVNPEPTPLTAIADWSFQAPTGQFLPQLVSELEQTRRPS